jgi:hypothetical protein
MSYASVDDIKARLPGRTIDTTSSPTSTAVTAWIAEAEALINNTLAGAGLPAPYTDASSILILKVWVCECVEGRTRMAHVSGDGTNDDGKDLVAQFFARLKDISVNAPRYGGMLAGGGVPAESVGVRGSNADGAIEPIFTRNEVW